MPIYEYQCEACGHKLEKIQKVNDDLLKDCPSCDEPRLNKLISAAGFRLKGDGWYETDFKSGSRKNVVAGESGGDSTDTGDGSSSGDSTDGGDSSGTGGSGGESQSDSGSNSKSESKGDSVPSAAG